MERLNNIEKALISSQYIFSYNQVSKQSGDSHRVSERHRPGYCQRIGQAQFQYCPEWLDNSVRFGESREAFQNHLPKHQGAVYLRRLDQAFGLQAFSEADYRSVRQG